MCCFQKSDSAVAEITALALSAAALSGGVASVIPSTPSALEDVGSLALFRYADLAPGAAGVFRLLLMNGIKVCQPVFTFSEASRECLLGCMRDTGSM